MAWRFEFPALDFPPVPELGEIAYEQFAAFARAAYEDLGADALVAAMFPPWADVLTVGKAAWQATAEAVEVEVRRRDAW
jgi:hypothetical protein